MRVFLLLLSICVPQAQAYASWLECYVELDTSEVIMNQLIMPAPNLENPNVAAQPEAQVTVQVKEFVEGHDEDENDETDGWTAWDAGRLEVTSLPALLRVRLHVPSSFGKRTMQYAIEVMSAKDGSNKREEIQMGADGRIVAKPALPGVRFVDDAAMCNGRRSSKRKQREEALLELTSDSKVAELELLAGWAGGFAAVHLTPTFKVSMTVAEETMEGETQDEL